MFYKIARTPPEEDIVFDALAPILPMQTLIIEVTSRCNLRCGYCPKGQPKNDQIPGRDMDMADDVLDVTTALARKYSVNSMILAGTGETTFSNGWRARVSSFLDFPGTKLLNTNLSAKFGDDDLNTLSKFDELVVSVDSTDFNLHRRLRSKSDLREILYNLTRLRMRTPSPRITFNCTVTNLNVEEPERLVAFAHSCGVAMLNFSDLVELESTRNLHGVWAVRHLPVEQRRKLVQDYRDAQLYGKELGVQVNLQPSLIESLEAMEEPHKHPESTKSARLCLQPWTRLNIGADGQYFPCCVTDDLASLGDLRKTDDPANSPEIRSFRERLIQGKMPEVCVSCTNAPMAESNDLIQAIARIHLIRNAK